MSDRIKALHQQRFEQHEEWGEALIFYHSLLLCYLLKLLSQIMYLVLDSLLIWPESQ